MPPFLYLISLLIFNFGSSPDEAQNYQLEPEIIQAFFNQISIEDSLMQNQSGGKVHPSCDILVLCNEYLSCEGQYLIGSKKTFIVDRSVLFQLNQNFLIFESILKKEQEINAVLILYKNDGTILKRWQLKYEK